jgi:hypothetical protein
MTLSRLLLRQPQGTHRSTHHSASARGQPQKERRGTGFLFYDGKRFAQVLEGPRVAVSDTYGRILRDARHRDIVLISCEERAKRQFGYWSIGL